MRLASLTAEAEAEAKHGLSSAEAGFYLIGFREGVRVRVEFDAEDLMGIARAALGQPDPDSGWACPSCGIRFGDPQKVCPACGAEHE